MPYGHFSEFEAERISSNSLHNPDSTTNQGVTILKVISKKVFPEVITNLPEGDIALEGVKAWIVQGNGQQLVFFEMQPSAKIPEHSHDYPQWGMVIEGKMEMTIDGSAKIYEKGDEYLVPARAKHSARYLSRVRVMDLFKENA